ncbi:MAG TPA: 5'-3' exonuclease [Candidatus Saccharimonadales bacterium]|nr:5'-3' exonuclease [Candidatus Saccharimonadales bacterium]
MLDAASLLYRAYHAIPEMRAPDGSKIHAAHGFLGFLTRLIPDRRADRLIVALDNDWRPAFRVEALPTYKTHRLAGPDDPPDDVGLQFPVLLEIFDAIGISYAEATGFEAEDVIATIAATAAGPVEIVTGDRDLFAVVRDPQVKVLYTLRGVSQLAEVDQGWIAAKYGIPGDRYLDYALLRGDPSDGLPGVAGIGEKTASGLLRRYGSLDAALAATGLDPAIRRKLTASAAYLEAARRVVAPAVDCPVRGGDGTLPRAPRDPDRLAVIAEQSALTGAVKRLVEALAGRA